jgi:hypothetical protein
VLSDVLVLLGLEYRSRSSSTICVSQLFLKYRIKTTLIIPPLSNRSVYEIVVWLNYSNIVSNYTIFLNCFLKQALYYLKFKH